MSQFPASTKPRPKPAYAQVVTRTGVKAKANSGSVTQQAHCLQERAQEVRHYRHGAGLTAWSMVGRMLDQLPCTAAAAAPLMPYPRML